MIRPRRIANENLSLPTGRVLIVVKFTQKDGAKVVGPRATDGLHRGDTAFTERRVALANHELCSCRGELGQTSDVEVFVIHSLIGNEGRLCLFKERHSLMSHSTPKARAVNR